MRKCIFRRWTLIVGLLAATAVSAQKNLSDYSIVDDCTPEAMGFEASLTPLFDKNDLTVFQLPQLQGTEEIILKANRPYILKGFSVVSADDEQQDLKQMVPSRIRLRLLQQPKRFPSRSTFLRSRSSPFSLSMCRVR